MFGKALALANLFSVVSIPILILRKTQMKTSQKLSLGVFLCLSIVMAITALIRMSAYRIRDVLDFTWQTFWVWIEACISIILGSAAAFRALLVQGVSKKSNEKPRGPSYSIHQRLLKRMKRSNDSSWEEMDGDALPQIPSAILTGVRTFIRGNNRTFGASTVMRSELEPMPEGRDEFQVPKSMSEHQIYVDNRVEIHSQVV